MQVAFYVFFATLLYPASAWLHPHGMYEHLAPSVPIGLHGLLKASPCYSPLVRSFAHSVSMACSTCCLVPHAAARQSSSFLLCAASMLHKAFSCCLTLTPLAGC